ncbi:MAG TPA: ribbon-helix-helix protein, CopG family, partial [Candidatus Aenigmarchaeota archaeon]|nr:ribbon-helix-helix protein, CopG family [Candidatus Aenigmarchaeota archaeon]
RITVRIPEDILEEIDNFLKTGKYSSRSEVIRHAIWEYVKNYRKEGYEL